MPRDRDRRFEPDDLRHPSDGAPEGAGIRVFGERGEAVEPSAPARLALALDDDLAPLEASFAGGSRDPVTLYGLAAARLFAGSPEAAREPLALLLARDPERESALELLAQVAAAEGAYEEALAVEERLLARAPEDGERHARRARARMLAGDRAGALEGFEEGARRDPRHFECARRAALLRLAEGEAEAALRLLAGFLAATDPAAPAAAGAAAERGARAEPPPALVDVRPDEPQMHAEDLGSRLAFAEAERRARGTRSFERAADRFQARVLVGHAEKARGDDGAAARAFEAAQDELLAVPQALLGEIAWRIGLDPTDLRALVAERRAARAADRRG